MNSTSKPITVSTPITVSNSTAPVTVTEPNTVTKRGVTARFDTSAQFPSTLPNMQQIKQLWASKTVTSDRDSSTPKKLDAGFLRRQFNEQYRIASHELTLASTANLVKDTYISFVINSGASISTGFVEYKGPIPWDATIQYVEVNSYSSGTLKVDLWAAANYPEDRNSICGGNEPELTEKHFRDSTLTGWSNYLYKGDIIGCNIDTVSGGISDAVITLGLLIVDRDYITTSQPVTVSSGGNPVTVTKVMTRGK